MYGEQGKIWLENLPILIAEIASRWNLKNLNSLPNLSYHYILAGFQGEMPIILKLGPDKSELNKEFQTLLAFVGCGVVSILAHENYALLLEQAIPGHSLRNYWPRREQEAIKIVCDCISKLHKAPVPKNVVHLKDWLSILDREWSAIPSLYLDKSRTLKNYLLQTSTENKLLHGDLHHDNILSHGKDWLVIDPKGVIGEGAYELAAYIRNPMPELLQSKEVINILQTRIHEFSSLLNLSEIRIYQWCFVQTILSWAWNLEDGLDVEYFTRLAQIFYPLLSNN